MMRFNYVFISVNNPKNKDAVLNINQSECIHLQVKLCLLVFAVS